jgi:hypothetical protein
MCRVSRIVASLVLAVLFAGCSSIPTDGTVVAVITDAGGVYSYLNQIEQSKWPKYGLESWPSSEVRRLGGKDAWGDWHPKQGDEGVIVHVTRHQNGKRIYILKIGRYYVPIGHNGVRISARRMAE